MQHRPIRTVLAATALTFTAPVALQAQYAPPSYPAPAYGQPAQPAPAYGQPAPLAQAYDPGQLDQMLAPIALYPDQLLGQILMASTYPQEVQDAATWLQDPTDASLRGEALTAALEQQDWDPSVKSLVPFPAVLQMLASHRDWMQQLGDAFLADQAAVMDSVQRLRHQAWNNGTLHSSPQQVVTMRGPDIVIEPANPNTVYVPTYNPTVVYGGWQYPDYPPYYYVPEGYAYGGPGISFGLSFAVPTQEWDWDHFDWRDHRVRIDRDRMSWWDRGRPERFREDRTAGNFWTHNPEHRRGVDYLNPALHERYMHTNIAPQQGTTQQTRQERNARQQYPQRSDAQQQQQRSAEQQQQERNAQQERNGQRQFQERNAQQQLQERNAQQQLQERNAQRQHWQESRPDQRGPTAAREAAPPRSEAPRAAAPAPTRNPEASRPHPAPQPPPRQAAGPTSPQRVEKPVPGKEHDRN